MIGLEEDNRQLGQELELYRRRETGASEQNQVLESKIQEVLDSMERLQGKNDCSGWIVFLVSNLSFHHPAVPQAQDRVSARVLPTMSDRL